MDCHWHYHDLLKKDGNDHGSKGRKQQPPRLPTTQCAKSRFCVQKSHYVFKLLFISGKKIGNKQLVKIIQTAEKCKQIAGIGKQTAEIGKQTVEKVNKQLK